MSVQHRVLQGFERLVSSCLLDELDESIAHAQLVARIFSIILHGNGHTEYFAAFDEMLEKSKHEEFKF